MQKVIHILDSISDRVGRFSSWFVLAMVLITCAVVIARYVLNIGSVFLQDVVLYLHGALFLLAAAYTLKEDGHVRVDIFYRDFSIKKKAIVNIIGNLLFLIPFALVVLFNSFEFVEFSWAIKEKSPEPDGVPYVYLQKSLLLVVCVLLLIQSLSEILKNFLTLTNG